MSQSQEPKPQKTLTPEQAKKLLWKKGNLTYKLDTNQVEMHKFIRNNEKKITVLGCSRQLGKSYMLCTLAIEECIKQPNRIVKFIAPSVKMIKRILRPLMQELLIDCPEEFRPEYKSIDHVYRFPNNSEIQIAGSDNGHADSIRGTKAHLCIIDEAGFCDDLEHLIKSILIPTTTTTKGKIVLSSTPPKSRDHEFMNFWDRAVIEESFIKRTIYDNPRLSEQDINDLAEAIGGINSIDFKREYLCQIITSEEDAVIPEFNDDTEKDIVKEWPRPPYYDAYGSMDIGVKDLTVVLFAYYDFKHAKLVIEDEYVINGKQLLTDKLAADVTAKEKALWVHPLTKESKSVFLRVSDNNNLILLNDLQVKHQLTFLPSAKDNNEAAINNMRMLIKNKKLIINPRCKTLISHLKNGIWNKARTSFVRSQDNGHFDAIDSLKYLCRAVNFNKNPYPANYQFDSTKDLFFSPEQTSTNTLHESFKEMFRIKRKRN